MGRRGRGEGVGRQGREEGVGRRGRGDEGGKRGWGDEGGERGWGDDGCERLVLLLLHISTCTSYFVNKTISIHFPLPHYDVISVYCMYVPNTYSHAQRPIHNWTLLSRPL